MSRVSRMNASEPMYVAEYDSASASASEVVKSGVVFLGSLVLDGFGIDHLIRGGSSTGIKELIGGVVLGVLSAAYGEFNVNEHKASFHNAQQLEAEYKTEAQA